MNNNRGSVILGLKIITTVASAFYAGGFLVSLLLARGSTPESLSVDRNLAGSSQVIISLLLVTATAAIWILPRKAQAISALIFVCAIAAAGYDWWATTSRIKANIGPTGTGRLSNTLIGATKFDALALVATVSLMALMAAPFVRGRSKQQRHPDQHFGLKASVHH
jgi:hypothetical protein